MALSKQQTPQFSAEFLEQLGIPTWSENPEFFHRPVEINAASSEIESMDDNVSQTSDVDQGAAVNGESNHYQSATTENSAGHSAQKSVYKSPVVSEESSEMVQSSSTQLSSVQAARVFIASGVDEIWQNEESLAWQLWENILLAFGWQESEVEFFDAATMVTEESLFDCMEAVMELPIDQVFVMVDEHPIIEMLQEGLEVVQLPSLDEMLDDPYAKQRFYQSVIQYA